MDQTQTYSVEAYRFPLRMEDHKEISRMLRERGVFAPSFVPQADADVYDPLLYRREDVQDDTTTILLTDRNVVTRWLALLADKTASPQDRLAAAIMVFAQSANILVEPNLALYEAAIARGSEAAKQELVQFRIADNLDIKYWADLALERTQKLWVADNELPTVPNNLAEIDFEMRLRRWVRNYIILLKLAELELKGLNRTRQITELATWMYQDFIMGGPALIFAIYYLTPNSERSGLLKNLRSADRERALRGIRNASWDLTLLSEWIRRAGEQKQTNTLTLLCSLDRKLIVLARMLAPHLASNLTDDEFRRLAMMTILEPWGKKQVDQIAGLIGGLLANPDNPSRQIHRPDEVDIDQMIEAGEKFVKDWHV
jgi:hypothetical protein